MNNLLLSGADLKPLKTSIPEHGVDIYYGRLRLNGLSSQLSKIFLEAINDLVLSLYDAILGFHFFSQRSIGTVICFEDVPKNKCHVFEHLIPALSLFRGTGVHDIVVFPDQLIVARDDIRKLLKNSSGILKGYNLGRIGDFFLDQVDIGCDDRLHSSELVVVRFDVNRWIELIRNPGQRNE